MISDYRLKTAHHRKISKFLILGFIVILVSGAVFFRVKTASSEIISPLPSDNHPNPFFSLFSQKKNPDQLRQKIQEAVGNSWKNYSAVVEDYNSSFSMAIGENVIYAGASVNKIPILAALYYLSQKGEVSLDQIITLQQTDIQDYGTGSIRYDPPGTTYSVKTLARLMMQKSDNTAAYLLANYVVGLDKTQALITSWGLAQTDMVNNKTSNHDMAILFRKIFQEKVTNHALTSELLSFLKDGEIEDRLPALLPPETTVYHKTGNAIGSLHDVGIIQSGKTKYYLGIFTSDVTNEQETIALMAKISKLVYDFMR